MRAFSVQSVGSWALGALRRAWLERRAPPLAAPPRGGTAAAAVLAGAVGLAALAGAQAAWARAEAWAVEFGGVATLALTGPAETRPERLHAARTVLFQTQGVLSLTPLGPGSLPPPWRGQLQDVEAPELFAVELRGTPPPADLVNLRLAAEAPGAVYDDHAAWSGPLLAEAEAARRDALLWAGAGLAGGAGAVGAAALGALRGRRAEIGVLLMAGVSPARLRGSAGRRLGLAAGLAAAAGAGLVGAGLVLSGDFGGLAWALAAPAVLGPTAAAVAGARLGLRRAMREAEA